MRNITNPFIAAWERSGLQALPMGQQAALIRDLEYSIRKAGREDLLMNAAGQTSGMLTRQRPAGEIFAEMIDEAVDFLARRNPERIQAAL